ncbi:MAG: right-handed parallel beta-helix repeat-containing protein [Bacteroidetes bacterium]|uniref:Right-handed parallel beta-helix repeat-containing protein n=1 Tax=Candidatus Cryptobacteroides faecipullorum TaxID=2840764 RepID=A0A9D9I733_9BACT|nr:right-handed parallel beta-helix repeat-containing protein [Candidatus Cryptobacteroides faecipullorum]
MMRFIFVLFLNLTVCVGLSAKDVITINNRLDLRGDTLKLKKGTVVRFADDGIIVNGMVIGDSSEILAAKRQIFGENVTIGGTWHNKSVYGQWMGLQENADNTQQFRNLLVLCTGDNMTHLYTSSGIYPVHAIYNSAPLLFPSNVYWHNLSTIRILPCSYTHYSIVLLHRVKNVTIDGGSFVGDVNGHIGIEGEWGHGIKCGGSTNITLKNLTCSYCWGDGIDLIEGRDNMNQPTIVCNKITIDNVKCLHNRRQGMSIEAAHNVKVSNSEFAYTGHPFMTKPAAGLDIEEWNADGHKMNYLTFKNCTFHNNVGFDMQSEPNWKMGREEYRKFKNNISFELCNMDSCRVTYTNGISFTDCTIQDMCVHFSNDVSFNNCKIEKLIKSKNDSAVKITSCKGKAFLSSYALPMGFVGMPTIIGLVLFAYKYYINENDRHYNNS